MRLLTLLVYLISLSTTVSTMATDTILIMTYVHSRPDFIELHHKTFKAFLKDPYEYVVFNDAPNPAMRQQIEQMCKKLGIRCFRVPDHQPHRQTAGCRHMDGIRYSLELIGFNHDGIVAMVDADMFLTKPLSIKKYMEQYNFVGGLQWRENESIKVVYSSPCLVFMDMRTLPNKRSISFEGGYVEGLACDVGGHLYYYFKDNPTVNVKYYLAQSTDHLPKNKELLSERGYDEHAINFIFAIEKKCGMEFHGGTYFVHYYAGGSNWANYAQEYLRLKDSFLYSFLEKQLQQY